MSDRIWLKSPKVALMTAYGPVEATFTDAGRASVRTDAHVNDNAPCLTFRGQDYLAHTLLHAEHDWAPRPGDLGSFRRRPQWTDAPRTHAEKMLSAIIDAVRAYAAEHPEVLRQAEEVDVNNTLIELERERAEAATMLAETDRRISATQARLTTADDE